MKTLIRKLKQGWRRRRRRRRRWLRQRHQTISDLLSKNKSYARPARAFHICVHFYPVLGLTTTRTDQIWVYLEDVHLTKFFNFVSEYPHCSHHFFSWNVKTHFPCRANWSNGKIITMTGNNVLEDVHVTIIVVFGQGSTWLLPQVNQP